MKKTVIVDVVYVNSVNSEMWAEGAGKGCKPKGGAVDTRLGTSVDGNLLPRARSWPSKYSK
jgi:hypothetical protein